MAWAQAVPSGARYDLTQSGIADALTGTDDPAEWSESVPLHELCRRQFRDDANEEFLAAVADRYGVERDAVVPSLGASQAITHAVFALVRPGDHVIVERPTYEALHRVPALLGADVSRLERKFEEDWAVVPDRLAQLLTPKTRAVLLSNLHNPSGVAIPTEALEAVGEMAARVGARVLVDEVYLDFSFDPEGGGSRPACRAIDNGVSWSSATKCFGFSAIRAGWIVTRNPAAQRLLHEANHYLQVHVPVATARIAARVLKDVERWSARGMGVARAGRAAVDAWLAQERRVAWVRPEAGPVGLVRLPELTPDVPFCAHLREHYETQVVPGTFFEAPGTVRLAFTGPVADLQQGLRNFSAALDDLQDRPLEV
jgi:aspartate/methionine/tyrosine aminotransferase